MGDTTVCLLLVPSFPKDVRLEQQLYIFVAPADKCCLCHATLPHNDSTCLLQAGTCPGHKIKYREKKLFNGDGDQKLAQVAWRACGVSILQDTQNPAGHSSEQPAAAAPALSRGRAGYSPEMPFCLNYAVSCIMELGSLIGTATCSCKINTNVWEYQSISLPFTFLWV